MHLLWSFQFRGRAPRDAVRYAQIDLVLASARWQNAIKNVESLPDIQVDSDHFVLIPSVLIKFKASKKPHAQRRFKFRQPSQEQVEHFNPGLLQSCSSLPDLATVISPHGFVCAAAIYRTMQRVPFPLYSRYKWRGTYRMKRGNWSSSNIGTAE